MAKYSVIESAPLVESLRDSGYKSAASAGAELADNAFQADASAFLITLEEKPAPEVRKRGPHTPGIARVVFSDDGKGMDPELLRNAVRFGYSTRFGDRTGMGRFGMGLPNASISQAETFEVYSRVARGPWYYVRLNLREIASGQLEEVPEPVVQDPPAQYVTPGGQTGTIVIWEDLDRLNMHWQSADKLQSHFVTELSRIFRYYLVAGRTIAISTPKSDKPLRVQPFDPLYLMPQAMYVGSTQHGDVIKIPVTTSAGVTDTVEVRFSLTPESWRVEEGVAVRANAVPSKERRINSNRGVSFVRADREIDFSNASGLKGTHAMNMWWSAEVSFPATLDEAFGIEFTKQRVVLTDQLYQTLKDKAFNGNAATLNAIIQAQRPEPPEQVTSAPAEEIGKRVRNKLRAITPASAIEGEDQGEGEGKEQGRPDREKITEQRHEALIRQAAAERKRAGETDDQARRRVEDLPFVLQIEDRPEAPFYRIETYGPHIHIILNRYHEFYKKVYRPLEQAGGNALTGIQLLLFALAQGEGQGGKDTKHYYADERQVWSGLLTVFLRELEEPKITTAVPETADDAPVAAQLPLVNLAS